MTQPRSLTRLRVRTGVTGLLALAVVTGSAPGCSPSATPARDDQSTPPTSATKNPPVAERHDLEPLTTRFPLLGEPAAATWFTGTVGSDRTPGPTTYWIDAVVDVAPSTVAALLAEESPTPTATAPDVVADLAAEVPEGVLLRSDGLDAAFSTAQRSASVWVSPSDDRVVVVSIGRG